MSQRKEFEAKFPSVLQDLQWTGTKYAPKFQHNDTYTAHVVNSMLEAWQAANAIQSHSGGEAVYTNTDRKFTMENRQFTQSSGYIQDNNFDFDAGFKISGDFLEGECEQYADMICNALNTDQSARIKEQQAERDMIFGLLKQLRVAMFNMCNEEQSDLEWIYNTNMLMKDIDFMFLHGYLQDSKTVITELQAANTKLVEQVRVMRKPLEYWGNECTGFEPSISVFAKMVEEALTAMQTNPTEGV